MNILEENLILIPVVLVIGAVIGWYLKDMIGKQKSSKSKKYLEQAETESEEKRGTELFNKFVPAKYLQILGISDMQQITLEDRKKTETNILAFNIDDFSMLISEVEAESMHAFINQILAECMPVIEQRQGVIEDFHKAGFTGIFAEESEQALEAAIGLCENMMLNAQTKKWFDRYSVGIVYGDIAAGLVGYGERVSILTISAYTNLADHIQILCHKYYTKIIVTGTFAQRIQDFDTRYNSRFIGYIYIRTTNTIEKLIDVFDGDLVQVRNMKRKTKRVFEQGVENYSNQNYMEARHLFIEVMKMDQKDKAAMEYVKMCDERLTDITQQESYIEIL